MQKTLAEGALQRTRVPVYLRSGLHFHFLVAMVEIQPMVNVPRDPLDVALFLFSYKGLL